MKDKGLIRNPGCSFIEHGSKIHRFVVGDQSHPELDKIAQLWENEYLKTLPIFRNVAQYMLGKIKDKATFSYFYKIFQ
ncbi:unnamed protein product [Malus baccata var. baccata]